MPNLDSVLKSRGITLPTKVRIIVKAMVFPVVMYGCGSWTIKKAEHRRIDAFELWYWRRFLRVPWTARRSNQSILKEIRCDSFEKTLMLGKIEGRRRRGWQRIRWSDGITDSMDMFSSVQSLSRVRLFATPCTAAYQAPPPMGFSRQEYWSGVPLPSPHYESELWNWVFPLRLRFCLFLYVAYMNKCLVCKYNELSGRNTDLMVEFFPATFLPSRSHQPLSTTVLFIHFLFPYAYHCF